MSADSRRRQLVEKGTELLLGAPIDELTGQRLAEVAGVSRGLVFHYFPTVHDLHLACLEQAAKELVGAIVTELSRSSDRGEMMRSALRVFVDYIANNPETFSRLSGLATADPDFGAVFDAARHEIFDAVLLGVTFESSRTGSALLAGWIAMVERSSLVWIRHAADGNDAAVGDELLEILGRSLDNLLRLMLESAQPDVQPSE